MLQFSDIRRWRIVVLVHSERTVHQENILAIGFRS